MLNKVILMGRLVADPEMRQTSAGIPVVRFRIAVDRPYQKDKERQADFISVTAWRSTAEFVNRFFSKGKMIIVEGSLRNNDYTDNNGIKHYNMDVLADNVAFGESKGASAGNSDNSFRIPDYLPEDSNPQKASSPAPAIKPADEAISIGDLGDFEEILSDGDVPF